MTRGSAEQWPDPNFHIGQHDHLHALGVIIATYNLLESTVLHLCNELLMLEPEFGHRLFAQMPIDKVIELAKSECEARENDPEVKVRVTHFFVGFGDLKGTRDYLAHSHTILNTPDQLHLTFGKGSRKHPTAWTFAHMKVEELREVADGMKAFWLYGSSLHAFVVARKTGGLLDFGSLGSRVPVLPIKPVLPTVLDKSSHGVVE